MAAERLKLDNNTYPVMGGVTDDANLEIRMLRVDPSTNRLKVDALLDLGADVIDLTTRDALAVGIVDGNGDQITSFGGGTQYATNVAYADGNTGTLGLTVRDDALTTLTEADGDFSVARVTSVGRLWVSAVLDTALPAGTAAIGKLAANSGVDIGDVDVTSVPTDPFGANADAASASGSISAKLRGIATALGITALDLGSGTGGSRTLRFFQDTAQFVGGTGTDTSATQRVSLATNVALPAGTNAIGKLSANSGIDIGDVDVTSISAGTNAIGNVGLIGRTTGGMSIFRSLDIDETEEDVKTSAGQVFSITAFNRTAAPLYLKFYNATAANVTVGSTTPVLTFLVPANADSDGAGFVWNNDIGFAFGTAISVACTTAVADADTGAPGVNDCLINVGYV